MNDSNDFFNFFENEEYPTMPSDLNEFNFDETNNLGFNNQTIFDTKSNDFDSSKGFLLSNNKKPEISMVNKPNITQNDNRKHRLSNPIRPLVPLSPQINSDNSPEIGISTNIKLEPEIFAPRINKNKNLKLNQQILYTNDDGYFNNLCKDFNFLFNPLKLGFIPKTYWPNQDYPFGILVEDFFRRKNNPNTRFTHKLYNSLILVNKDPLLAPLLGVEWVNDTVLKVNSRIFGRLLGIKTVKGSLFHSQGNFPSHGFYELNPLEASNYVDSTNLIGVDFEDIRLLIHQNGIFIKNCQEIDIENCKWIPIKPKK